jgi:hypothetical protein
MEALMPPAPEEEEDAVARTPLPPPGAEEDEEEEEADDDDDDDEEEEEGVAALAPVRCEVVIPTPSTAAVGVPPTTPMVVVAVPAEDDINLNTSAAADWMFCWWCW